MPRRFHPIRPSAALLAAAVCGIAPLIAQPAAEASGGGPAGEVAERVLMTGEPEGSELRLTAALRFDDDPPSAAGSMSAVLELLVEPVGAAFAAPGAFRIFALLALIDGDTVAVETAHAAPGLEGASGWLLRLRLEVPEETDQVAVVVEQEGTGRWAAAAADRSSLSGAAGMPRVLVQEADLRPGSGRQGGQGPAEAQVIRLLPPPGDALSGRVRIRTLVTSDAVRRAEFYLDGELVAEDDSPPFGAIVDLGVEVGPRTVRVRALSRHGGELGADSVRLNSRAGGLAVTIVNAGYDPAAAAVVIEAELSGGGDPPARLEFYWNETPVATLDAPPYRAAVDAPAPPSAQDYVRVVARLPGGEAVEDARLLGAAAERVEVNLVEIYCVATARDGSPVDDLRREEIVLMRRGQPQPIERFGPAEEVPLLLGLVIDTSESMWPLMPDTKQAGARFLAETVLEDDRAFLVDFDTRPRLAHPMTSEVADLLRRFAGLRADGFTALYDAVIFSLLQFEETPGRRALVVLTDGDDYRSRFGARRAIEQARAQSVPVYIIGLGGLHDPRRGLRKIDLEGLAEATGGRVFYIARLEELGEAYAAINLELRKQLLLTHATAQRLSADELAEFRVEVSRPGVEVRSVIGQPR